MRRRGWGCGNDFMRGDDDDIDAAIEAASVFGGVVGDGMKLSISGGGKAAGSNGFTGEKKTDDLGGASGGEFPVGLELRGVNGDVVGVALDTDIT